MILVVAIFFIGMLPLPTLAVTNGTISGYISDNSTGDPVTDAMV